MLQWYPNFRSLDSKHTQNPDIKISGFWSSPDTECTDIKALLLYALISGHFCLDFEFASIFGLWIGETMFLMLENPDIQKPGFDCSYNALKSNVSTPWCDECNFPYKLFWTLVILMHKESDLTRPGLVLGLRPDFYWFIFIC